MQRGAAKRNLPADLSPFVQRELSKWPSVPSLTTLSLERVRGMVREKPDIASTLPVGIRQLLPVSLSQ